jgi:hypothetical protein
MPILSSDPTELGSSPPIWGGAALAAEILHFILFWTFGPITFGPNRSSHPIAASIILFAWLLGFVGGGLAVTGLFKDESKWASVLALLIFPFSILVLA